MKKTPLLILVGYRKNSGKDTFSRMLLEILSQKGVETNLYHFAYPIKKLVSSLIGLPMEKIEELKNGGTGITWGEDFVRIGDCKYPLQRERFLETALRFFGKSGIERAKAGMEFLMNLEPPTMRETLQLMGTEAMKTMFCEEVWIDVATRLHFSEEGDCTRDAVIVPDFRFPVEYEYTKKIFHGETVTIRIDRPGLPDDAHSSEKALEDFPFDHVVVNDGSLEDLKEKAKNTAETLLRMYKNDRIGKDEGGI